MKKLNVKIKKLLSLVIATFMTLSVTACGFYELDLSGGNGYDGTAGTGLSNGAVAPNTPVKAVQTNKIMTENGKTDYKIVLPTNLGSWDNEAKNELVTFLRTSTGISFSVISDEGLTFSESDKYISLGRTRLFEQAGLAANESELSAAGYVIKTVGNSIFICGGKSKGTMYGVYEFLHHAVGYEYYAADEIALNNLTKLYLFDFDIKTIPSFESPYLSSSIYLGDTNGNNRYRVTNPWIPSAGMHCSFILIDKETYNDPNKPETYHPEYYAYSENGQTVHQLCYSAEGLDEVMFEKFIPYLEKSYLPENYKEEQIYFFFGQEDYWGWCRCANCKAEYEKYGTDAAVLVKFINKVAEKVEAWVNENQPGREVILSTFAYQDTEKPPVKYDSSNNIILDENGKAIPIDESVRLRENVMVRLAPIEANWYESFAADSNKYTQNVLEGWSALGKVALYLYSIGFSSHYAQFNNFNSLQETYQYVKETLGAEHCYDQYLSTGKGYPAFNAYRAYLQSNLLWNVYADQEKLTKDFFNNYYREAADIMLRYLDEVRVLYMDNWREVGLKGDCNTVNLYIADLWPRGTLLGWLEDFEEAKKAIAHYQTMNPELYEKLMDRITMETLSVRYLIIRLYGNVVYSPQALYEEKVEFFNLVQKYDMYLRNAIYNFDNLKTELGI